MLAPDFDLGPAPDNRKNPTRGLAKTRGDAGELAVARYLLSHGFTLLAHQYLVPRLGEIDLVMKKELASILSRSNPDPAQRPMAAVWNRSRQPKSEKSAKPLWFSAKIQAI